MLLKPDNKKLSFGHVILDLETLDTEPGGVILSIGAIPFDLLSGKTGDYFYAKINVPSSLDLGFTISAETTEWWLRQDPEVFLEALSGKTQVVAVLQDLSKWFAERTSANGEGLYIWGNSNRFDLGLLSAYYKKCNLPIPWNFYKELDVRTLVFFSPDIKKEVVGEAKARGMDLHTPIADCQIEIEYCSKIYNKLNLK